MTVRSFLSALSISVGLFAALPGVAGASVWNSHVLNAQEVQGIHVGDHLDAIVKRLGDPDNITKWPDGTRSAAYEVSDSLVGLQIVYVNLNHDDTVRSVEVRQR